MCLKYRQCSNLVVCVPANTHTFFMPKKQSRPRNLLYRLCIATASLCSFYLHLFLVLLADIVVVIQSFFLFQQLTYQLNEEPYRLYSTNQPPFRPLERASLSVALRLLLYYNIYILKTSKHYKIFSFYVIIQRYTQNAN